MAEQQAGWEIHGRFFPHNGADALRHGDFALIREVTGMTLDDFDRGDDPLATETGWLAVAVWQAQPELRRDQVRNFIETLPAGGATRVGWETDAAPLTPDESLASGSSSNGSGSQPADGSSPSASANTTRSPAEQTPEASSPDSSGGQQSATGATSDPPSSEASMAVQA